MIEKWKTVAFFPSYQVSNLGHVRGSRGPLKPRPRKGYMRVRLYYRGFFEDLSIHRLVLETFRGSAHADEEANHINFDLTDNRLANLEWVTAKENVRHTVKHGRQVWPGLSGEACGASKLSESDVRAIRILCATTDLSQTAIAKRFGVQQGAVSRIIHGHTWGHLK